MTQLRILEDVIYDSRRESKVFSRVCKITWLVFIFIYLYTMDELQNDCCTEWPMWIIQSIINKQDSLEKDLIQLQVLALDIASKLWLDMYNPSESSKEEIPVAKLNWLHFVNRRESENKGRLVDVMHTLREINSQL